MWMSTGDNRVTAAVLAKQLSIAHVHAEVLPADKHRLVVHLQNEGKVVAMLGDGINDAPALAQADLGMAVGAGTDVAKSAAQVVLVQSRLADVLTALDLSCVAFARIKLNFFFAFAYNALGIPLAAGVLFPLLHARLSPELSGLAMAMSSVSVVMSSLLLKSYTPPDLGSAKESGNAVCPCASCGDISSVGYQSFAEGKGVQVLFLDNSGQCCRAGTCPVDCACGCTCHKRTRPKAGGVSESTALLGGKTAGYGTL